MYYNPPYVKCFHGIYDERMCSHCQHTSVRDRRSTLSNTLVKDRAWIGSTRVVTNTEETRKRHMRRLCPDDLALAQRMDSGDFVSDSARQRIECILAVDDVWQGTNLPRLDNTTPWNKPPVLPTSELIYSECVQKWGLYFADEIYDDYALEAIAFYKKWAALPIAYDVETDDATE